MIYGSAQKNNPCRFFSELKLFPFSPYFSMHASGSRTLTCECNVPAFLFLLSYELKLSFTALWTLIQPVTLFSILLTRNALPLHSVTSDSYICKCTHLCLPWKRNILLLDTVFPVCLHRCLHVFALRRGTTLVWRLKYEEHYSLICLLHLGKSTSACIPNIVHC